MQKSNKSQIGPVPLIATSSAIEILIGHNI